MASFNGTPADDTYTGSAGSDTISGGDGSDTLNGGGGNDEIDGGPGDLDLLKGDAGNDVIHGGAGQDQLMGGAGDDTLFGDDGNDTIFGDAFSADSGGHDIIDGGNGDDLLIGNSQTVSASGGTGDDIIESGGTIDGGDGNDAIKIFNAGAIQSIDGGAGDDRILNGKVNGTSTIVVHGGDGNDIVEIGGTYVTIYGDGGNDIFSGSYANTSLSQTYVGGTGDDTYYYYLPTQTLVEAANEGQDTIVSGISLSLADNFENLTLTDYGAASAIGNSAANILTGNSANNLLDGKDGADIMIGGYGSDSYVVDDAGDQIVEADNTYGGIDTVSASTSYTLSANVENLTLAGTGNIDGTGNADDNVLIGNSGDNVLTGGAGSDILNGGAGIDTAVFSGSQSDYRMVRDGATLYVAGGASVDTLRDVEVLQFGDKTLNLVTGPAVTGDLIAKVGIGNSYTLTSADLGFTDIDDSSITFEVSHLSHGAIWVGGMPASHFTSEELMAGQVAFHHDGSTAKTAGFDVTASDGASTSLASAFSLTVTGYLVGHDVGEIEIVSTNSEGVLANGSTLAGNISADGRYVLMQSKATNFAISPHVAPGSYAVFVKDMWTGEVRQVDQSQAGRASDGNSYLLDLSSDGRQVLFASTAANLGPNSDGNTYQVYRKDMTTGVVTMISATNGQAGNSDAYEGVMSADGSLVFISSLASNLGNYDLAPGYNEDLYAKILNGPLSFIQTYDWNEEPFGRMTIPVGLSDDGSKLLFLSAGSHIVLGDTNGRLDLFVADTYTRKITAVTAGPSGIPVATSGAGSPTGVLSADGTRVLFSSTSSALSPLDTHGLAQIYVKDLLTGTVTLVSVNAAGEAINLSATPTGFSSDGRTAYFTTRADNLVTGDTNAATDIFAYDLTSGRVTRLVAGNGASVGAIGAGLDAILFNSLANNLVAGDTNGTYDTFLMHITGNDVLTGEDGNDQIFGKGGDDLLTGGKGNDSIDGGDGMDIAVFSGARSQYTVSKIGDTFTLTSLTDGTDQVTGVEQFRFSDGTVGAAALLTPLPSPPPAPPPPPPAGFVRLAAGDDTVSYAASTTAVQVQGLGGNDGLTGSKYGDSLNGGDGDDHISGLAGKDTITGGKGADRMSGGGDSDTFIFNAGDLPSTGIDHVIDFHGAGQPLAAGGEQDFLRFQGFGAGATLVFDHNASNDAKLQVYRVVDPIHAANNGFILVQMADGNAHLGTGDYGFY